MLYKETWFCNINITDYFKFSLYWDKYKETTVFIFFLCKLITSIYINKIIYTIFVESKYDTVIKISRLKHKARDDDGNVSSNLYNREFLMGIFLKESRLQVSTASFLG